MFVQRAEQQDRADAPEPDGRRHRFLPAGTPIHAVNGWDSGCRLAAAHSGRLHVYLAQEPNAERATVAACALPR